MELIEHPFVSIDEGRELANNLNYLDMNLYWDMVDTTIPGGSQAAAQLPGYRSNTIDPVTG